MPVSAAREIAALIVPSLVAACGGDGGAIGPATSGPTDPPQAIATQIIDDFAVEDLAVIVGDASGEIWTYEKGGFSADEAHLIASASKWLSASVIMTLVEQGVLELSDNPQDHLAWWTSAVDDVRSHVTLEQLLSFTAGFDHSDLDVACIEDATTTLDQCAQTLYAGELGFDPGSTFSYGPAHLQVAAAMAEQATGQSFRALLQLQLVSALGLTQTDAFVPSPANPRVAGGLTSSARDYATFLRALLSGDFLASVRGTMLEDRTALPVVIAQRPSVIDDSAFDFHYALGAWRECLQPLWDTQCEPVRVASSPGAFGWYPWIDFERGYFAVIAMREGTVDGQSATAAAMALSLQLRPIIDDIVP
ncbi:MAG: serine hydrolase domain-containing protein [Gammaproteobacteria bacterium]